MNPASWKWIVALAFGSAIGVAIRHGLFLLFGHSERAISVSTVTASSILGGFSGAAIGYVMAAPGLSQELQTLFMFGLLEPWSPQPPMRRRCRPPSALRMPPGCAGAVSQA